MGNIMKRLAIASLLLCVTLFGCAADRGQEANSASYELNIFAAASLQETLEQITENYCDKNPSATVNLNLDSSGTLKTQIEEGAPCDIFISAAQKQMDQLSSLELVDTDTRINLLENKVVLVVPENNPKGIMSFQDITEKADTIALGNQDVPVGQYSEEILTHLGILETLQSNGKITYGSNVKEVTTQVSEGLTDCGIIYATDAFVAGLTIVDEASEDICTQVIYPAAVMKASEHKKEAQEFLDYLQTSEAKKIFEDVGFRVVEQEE